MLEEAERFELPTSGLVIARDTNPCGLFPGQPSGSSLHLNISLAVSLTLYPHLKYCHQKYSETTRPRFSFVRHPPRWLGTVRLWSRVVPVPPGRASRLFPQA